MCFVWILEQTTIIFLRIINGLVFITETKCAYCAVRTAVGKVALWQVFLQFVVFPLTVSFRQSSIYDSVLMLRLSEGQAGEAWGSLNKEALFRVSGRIR